MAESAAPPSPVRRFALPVGPLLAVLVGVLAAGPGGLPGPAAATAGIAALCAFWWILEPVPVAATALIPFATLPLAGALDHSAVAQAYGHSLILLLMGGFMLSAALERSGAHRRLALAMVRLAGTDSRHRVVGAFMVATALSSMWISNTATALMMLPVALALIEHEKAQGGDSPVEVPLLLAIAWSASIGGLGTPVGSPPNVIFMGVYKEMTGTALGFVDWMRFGVPAVLLLLPVAWLVLVRRMPRGGSFHLPPAGRWSPTEKRVLAIFGATAAAWVFRTEPFGGWAGLLDVPMVGDSTIALVAVALLFVLPDGEARPGRLLDWPTAARIPWGLLLLFGGGIALARAFESTGLAARMGDWLALDLGLSGWSPLAAALALCLAVTFLTEITSNTATTTLLMPVLGAAGLAAGIDPIRWMVPAALSASCAFMLPVATAPNAIVFGTGAVSTARMAREGLRLNLAGAVLLALLCWALLP